MKIIKGLLLAFFAIIFTSSLMACSNKSIDSENIYGFWHLTEHRIDNRGGETFRSGHALWSGGYFINFNRNGTFSELNFWTSTFEVVTGSWELEGSTVILTRQNGSQGNFDFIGSRSLSLSENYATLTMNYSRRFDGTNFRYVATFMRVTNII